MSKNNKNESGFALLLTIIVVGVVLSIGLSIYDLSVKQLRLSTNAKESEIAFHAANAGMECARYWRRKEASDMEEGKDINPECFGQPVISVSHTTGADQPVFNTIDGNGEVHLYEYLFTWGVTSDRCTEISAVVSSSSPLSYGVTTTNMTTLIPAFPNGDVKHCEPGSKCSVISVRGYNKPCSNISGYGVVQREVLLQF